MAQVLANPGKLQLKPRAESCRPPAVTATNASAAVLFETGNRRILWSEEGLAAARSGYLKTRSEVFHYCNH